MITVERATKTRWLVEVGGRKVRADPLSATSLKKAGDTLGVEPDAIRAAIDVAERPPEPEGFTLTVDGFSVERETPLEALRVAFLVEGEFIRWDGRDRLCAVDVDIEKGVERLGDEVVADWGRKAGAELAWETRSGGGRLVFCADEINTAEEKACAAAVLLDLGDVFGVDRVEILSNTRKPPGVVAWDSINPVSGSMLILVASAQGREWGEAEDDEIEVFLASRGLARGVRAPHEFCPIEPKPVAGDDPVIALDGGIYCYRCANTGGDGFRSYGSLLGLGVRSGVDLIDYAHARVHWGHVV